MTGLTIAFSAAAMPVAIGWLYLASLSVAALGHGPSPRGVAGRLPRLTVLVPAHDEAALVATCVDSLLQQSYPASLRRVMVIADNCTDTTAAEAARAGATVMVRDEPGQPGKGRALRWAMDRLLSEEDSPDGFVIVDADSIAGPGLLSELARALGAGADLAQADYTVLEDQQAGSGDQLRAMAVLLYNRTRNLGRAALGLPAALLGNGMLLSRELVRTRPWTAFSPAEDLEFGMRCRIAGIGARFVSAGVRGPLPLGYSAGTAQRVRWEGGRFYVLKRLGPSLLGRLVRRPDAAILDAVLDLAVPPIAILATLTMAGLAVSLGAALLGWVGAAAPALWAACVALATVHLLAGLKAAGVPGRRILLLRAVPGFLAWKLSVYVRLLRGFDPNRWDRSLRKGESG